MTYAAAGRSGRVVGGGLVLLVSAALTAGALAGGPVAAATAPGAPAMPQCPDPRQGDGPGVPAAQVPGVRRTDPRRRPGSEPGTAAPTSGSTCRRRPGSTLLWGDWNRDGAYTPAVFTNGHWVDLRRDGRLRSGASAASSTSAWPGDKPVVGDFNRDGRTDVGVVRGGVWLLRRLPVGRARPGAGSPSAGRPTSRSPGTGTVTAGTAWASAAARAGSCCRRPAELRRVPHRRTRSRSGGTPTGRSSATGTATAKDTVGAVRGSSWFLRDRLSLTPTKGMTAEAAPGRGALHGHPPRGDPCPGSRAWWPAPWTTPAGPTGAACATASAGVANRNQVSALVQPSLLLDKALPYDPANPALATDPVFQLRTVAAGVGALPARRAVPRAVVHPGAASGTPTCWPGSPRPSRSTRSAGRRWRRSPTAVAARTGAHNDASVGPHPRRGDPLRRLAGPLDRLRARRRDPGRLGRGLPDRALGDARRRGRLADLGPAHPADPRVRRPDAGLRGRPTDSPQPVEYWADASGTVVSRGDTRARTTPGTARALELAVSMMPTHPHAANWRRKAVDLEVAAYARLVGHQRADAWSTASPLADRLDGANAYDDGTVENHHILHPDYMTNIQQNWWAVDFAGLAGRKAPASAAAQRRAGLRRVHHRCRSPPAHRRRSTVRRTPSPGGTIYRPGSNDIYFPQGSTWGTVRRRAPFVSFDAHALRLRAGHVPRLVGAGRAGPAHGRPAGPGGQQRHRRRPDLQLRPADREPARTATTAVRSTRPRSWRPAGWPCTSAATPGTSSSTCRPGRRHLRPAAAADAGRRPAGRRLPQRLQPGRRAAQPVAAGSTGCRAVRRTVPRTGARPGGSVGVASARHRPRPRWEPRHMLYRVSRLVCLDRVLQLLLAPDDRGPRAHPGRPGC